MTIEFQCLNCEKVLRAADGMAGRKAKCGGCGTVVAIPFPAQHFWPPGFTPPGSAAKPAAPPAPLATPSPQAAKPANPAPPATAAEPVRVAPAKPEAQPARAAPLPPPAVANTPTRNPNGAARAASPPIAQAVPPVAAHGVAKPPVAQVPVKPPVAQPPKAMPPQAVPPMDSPLPTVQEADDIDDLLAGIALAAPAQPPPAQAAPVASQAPQVRASSSRSRSRSAGRLSYGAVLARTWQLYKRNFWSLVGTTIALMALMLMAQLALGLAMSKLPLPPIAQLIAPAIVNLWFLLGWIAFNLSVAREHSEGWDDWKTGASYLLPGLAIWATTYVPLFLAIEASMQAELPGLALPIIMLLPAASYFFLFPSLMTIIDQGCSPLEAMQRGALYSARNFLVLVGLALTSMLLVGMGLLMCGLGIPLATAFSLLLMTVAYASSADANE